MLPFKILFYSIQLSFNIQKKKSERKIFFFSIKEAKLCLLYKTSSLYNLVDTNECGNIFIRVQHIFAINNKNVSCQFYNSINKF